MRFLVLLSGEDHYAWWAAAGEAEQERFFAGLRAFRNAVEERGRLLLEEPLTHPTDRRRMTGAPGNRSVTSGPFAESVEQVSGFYVVDLPDREAALEVAGLLPVPLVDVLPILDVSEQA